jgi:PAS domain S-box-containing protein
MSPDGAVTPSDGQENVTAPLITTDDQYHMLTDAIPALVGIVDRDGKSLYRNRSFYEYTGFTEEQALDWWNAGLVLQEDILTIAQEWQRAVANGRQAEAEIRVRGRDGNYRWHIVRAVPLPIESRWLLIATDIHDRKVAEEELKVALTEKDEAVRLHRAVEEQLTLLIEASSGLIGSLKLEEMAPRILRISVRLISADAYALWKLDDDGKHWRMLTAEGLPEAYLGASALIPVTDDTATTADTMVVRDVKSEGALAERQAFYERFGIKSILVLPLSIAGKNTGTLTFYYMKPHDFTEGELRVGTALANLTASAIGLARLTEQQEHTTRELREANSVKDEFLGMVSHELKTPLTMILGASDILTKHGDRIEAADRTASLQDINENARRLSQLVDNLLLLSRLEAGGQIETEPILVRHEIQNVVAEYRRRHPDREFTVTIDPTISPVSADPTNLRHILQNLLGNAVKYSPPGSPIDVTTAREGSDLIVSVLDRGSGISPDEIQLLFDPFYRSERNSKTASGAGVGLTVCRRLIEAQGGRIWAQPREGGGAGFSIALPVDEPPEHD